ncbi:hypothetical protein T484DRAFT_1858565 [Baffinella frigidus]|nr:hypothetical protein T484DRAFT_1858565 [Cryptophyta sp. CCMP2293]
MTVGFFASNVGFPDVAELLKGMVNRVQFGCAGDIAGLCELDRVQVPRARALLKAGFRTVAQVAGATVQTLSMSLGNKPKATAAALIESAQKITRREGMERERELLKLVDKMKESRESWESRAPDT